MFSRRKNPDWSRPLSEQVARSTYIDPPNPRNFTGKKVLLVGGNPDFVPAWIIKNFDFKHFTRSRDSFYSSLGDFWPDVIILFVKATDGHTKHQTFDFGKNNDVPILVMYKGWSHCIEDARERGLHWLANKYPHKTYVPEEDRRKRRERKTRKPPTNQRRQRAFEAAGITKDFIPYGRTHYIKPGDDKCVLCGTRIKYLYGLDFNLPWQADTVSFFPVGSTCIRYWVSSLPKTPEFDKVRDETQRELDFKAITGEQLEFDW